MGAVIAIVVLASIATVGIVVDVIIASNNARQTAAIQENSRQQLLPIGATMIEAHRTIIEVDSHTEKIAKSQQVIQEATRSLVAAQPDKPINNDPSTTGPQRLTIAK